MAQTACVGLTMAKKELDKLSQEMIQCEAAGKIKKGGKYYGTERHYRNDEQP